MPDSPEFDAYADHYGTALEKGIAISGEGKDFFAEGRIRWLKGLLEARGLQPQVVMDYGCGTGSATPYFFNLLQPDHLIGVDVSDKSLDVARSSFQRYSAEFVHAARYEPRGEVDVAFCNGVFHHIPLDQREGAVEFVWRSLRPGGLFAFCENNPWNPGTHLVMARIPFDRDAIKIQIPGAKRLLAKAGFVIERTDSLFYFPSALKFLRGLEPALARLPFGAQYMILVKKPG
jgi:SAM-dependent methyltransferase